jgi:hypothetical protein
MTFSSLLITSSNTIPVLYPTTPPLGSMML